MTNQINSSPPGPWQNISREEQPFGLFWPGSAGSPSQGGAVCLLSVLKTRNITLARQHPGPGGSDFSPDCSHTGLTRWDYCSADSPKAHPGER